MTEGEYTSLPSRKLLTHSRSKALKTEVKRLSDYGAVLHAPPTVEDKDGNLAAPAMMIEGRGAQLAIGGDALHTTS